MSYFSRYIRLPVRPEGISYAVGAPQLIEFDTAEDFEDYLLGHAEQVLFFATPDTDRYQWVGEEPLGNFTPSLPGLSSPSRVKRYLTYLGHFLRKNPLSLPIAIAVAIGVPWFMLTNSNQSLLTPLLALAFGFRYVITQLQRAAALVSHSAKGRQALIAYHQFQIWMGTTQVQGVFILPIILVVLFVGQLVYGFEASIQDYGLVKSAVREQGEYFRLFTSTLLHGSILHIFFNASALMALSGLMLRFVSWAWVFGTYLLSALAGSLASLWLLPEGTSVGASGAILGIFGFVVVLGLRFRHIFPFSFTLNSLFDVAFIAMYGLLGSTIIDNAAHAGGFLMGALLALAVRESTLIQRIDVLSQPFRDSQGGTLQAEAQASQPAGNT